MTKPFINTQTSIQKVFWRPDHSIWLAFFDDVVRLENVQTNFHSGWKSLSLTEAFGTLKGLWTLRSQMIPSELCCVIFTVKISARASVRHMKKLVWRSWYRVRLISERSSVRARAWAEMPAHTFFCEISVWPHPFLLSSKHIIWRDGRPFTRRNSSLEISIMFWRNLSPSLCRERSVGLFGMESDFSAGTDCRHTARERQDWFASDGTGRFSVPAWPHSPKRKLGQVRTQLKKNAQTHMRKCCYWGKLRVGNELWTFFTTEQPSITPNAKKCFRFSSLNIMHCSLHYMIAADTHQGFKVLQPGYMLSSSLTDFRVAAFDKFCTIVLPWLGKNPNLQQIHDNLSLKPQKHAQVAVTRCMKISSCHLWCSPSTEILPSSWKKVEYREKVLRVWVSNHETLSARE